MNYHSELDLRADRAAENDAKITARQLRRANERGNVCVYPTSTELFLDIDSLDGLGRLHAALAQNYYIQSIVRKTAPPIVRPSPSGKAGRFHVIVFLNKQVDKFERITLQALLGSDLSRELLSYSEAQAGVECPTVFFEKVLSPDAPEAPKPPSPTAVSAECPIVSVKPSTVESDMGGRY